MSFSLLSNQTLCRKHLSLFCLFSISRADTSAPLLQMSSFSGPLSAPLLYCWIYSNPPAPNLHRQIHLLTPESQTSRDGCLFQSLSYIPEMLARPCFFLNTSAQCLIVLCLITPSPISLFEGSLTQLSFAFWFQHCLVSWFLTSFRRLRTPSFFPPVWEHRCLKNPSTFFGPLNLSLASRLPPGLVTLPVLVS